MNLGSPLLTDFYQLTMLHAYFANGMRDTAVFEFFVRKLAPNRNFMMAAGLEQVLVSLDTTSPGGLGRPSRNLTEEGSRSPRVAHPRAPAAASGCGRGTSDDATSRSRTIPPLP